MCWLIQAEFIHHSLNLCSTINTLKCDIKKLAKTKSETFSYICGETVTYGEVVLTMVGFAAVMAMVMIGGFIFGGEVA